METCCTHNMMRLTRSLYARGPQIEYVDYFERALYNGILASQDPETGMMTYFQSTRPGYVRLYHTPFDSFWCCTGSGIENHARYGESIYAHDDEALYHQPVHGLDARSGANAVSRSRRPRAFPDEDVTRIRFDAEKKQRLKIHIRHPAWCAEMRVQVNGKRDVVSRKPGSYFTLPGDRLKPGDTITVQLPMTLRLEPLPNATDHAALVYGPIVLAAPPGHRGSQSRLTTHHQ